MSRPNCSLSACCRPSYSSATFHRAYPRSACATSRPHRSWMATCGSGSGRLLVSSQYRSVLSGCEPDRSVRRGAHSRARTTPRTRSARSSRRSQTLGVQPAGAHQGVAEREQVCGKEVGGQIQIGLCARGDSKAVDDADVVVLQRSRVHDDAGPLGQCPARPQHHVQAGRWPGRAAEQGSCRVQPECRVVGEHPHPCAATGRQTGFEGTSEIQTSRDPLPVCADLRACDTARPRCGPGVRGVEGDVVHGRTVSAPGASRRASVTSVDGA